MAGNFCDSFIDYCLLCFDCIINIVSSPSIAIHVNESSRSAFPAHILEIFQFSLFFFKYFNIGLSCSIVIFACYELLYLAISFRYSASVKRLSRIVGYSAFNASNACRRSPSDLLLSSMAFDEFIYIVFIFILLFLLLINSFIMHTSSSFSFTFSSSNFI